MDRPDWSLVTTLFDELKRVSAGLDDTQRRMAAVTGAARSPDRLISVTVGPRGQLLGLDIDPRALRNPDSKALASAILATARAAVQEAAGKSRAVLDAAVPSDLRISGSPMGDALLHVHDTDLMREGERTDG
ncbi:YbaB/EbfC family nucleoid-associated protein [Catenulispora rubra]|uniref:YbaB/EbfC family nucleoid-associated protein n=1 Tax=Catenulispora rubra TaxID=280293 RepID=UPI00189237DF|nr:YbaB/EbfC family nucleoid-associated protein [Catenulispora rubra]